MNDERAKALAESLRLLDCLQPTSYLRDAADELERLREALKPFAAIAEHHAEAGYAPATPSSHDDRLYAFHLVPGKSGVVLRLSDCQRAVEVLK